MDVGTYVVKRLSQWGVHRIYGYPGDGVNRILGAVRELDEIAFVQVRHEEMAAFMACGHAKFTGEPGVCLATSGPGAIHLLNGLYDAKMDRQPVVAIVGQTATFSIGGDFQQEVDLEALFSDVASEYVHTITTPKQARHVIDRAMRIAIDRRTVTCVIIPKDVQELEAPERAGSGHGIIHTGVGYSAPRVLPKDKDLVRAAEILNSGERVAMLIGAGALQAADEVVATADVLGAGVAKALLGKAALPDSLPFVTGSIGLLGTRPTAQMMDDCDTLLMIGSSFPYSEFLPKEGQAHAIQIDLDGRMLSLRYPMDVNLVGDSRETLRALLPLLRRKADRSWREQVERNVRAWWMTLEARAMQHARPLNPQRLFWDLSPRLPDNCIVTADAGSVAHWYARDLKMRPGMRASLSGNLATMGPGIPYAIAAKFAFPERVAIALVGDGTMQMNGINALITIGKYWRTWADPRLVVLVLNNGDLNFVTWEMRAMEGEPRFDASQDLPAFPYARYAEDLGLGGIRVDHPDQVASAWDAALAADRPVLIEAITDPDVPPLPPHITREQAMAFSSALLEDPRRVGIARQAFKEFMAGVLPHRK